MAPRLQFDVRLEARTLHPAILSPMVSAFRFSACLCLGAAALAVTASAQAPPRTLTIDAIYDPDERVDFSGTPTTNLRWIDDSTYLQRRRAERGVEWLAVDAASGRTSALFDPSRMEAALAAMPGITEEEASERARANDLILNPSRTGTLLTIDDDLYFYDFASNAAARLTSVPGTEEEATFSPNGRLVAFVRGNNLHVVDTGTRLETRHDLFAKCLVHQ